jgi:hypothetical protein
VAYTGKYQILGSKLHYEVNHPSTGVTGINYRRVAVHRESACFSNVAHQDGHNCFEAMFDLSFAAIQIPSNGSDRILTRQSVEIVANRRSDCVPDVDCEKEYETCTLLALDEFSKCVESRCLTRGLVDES